MTYPRRSIKASWVVAWKPVFLPETDSLVETWTEKVAQFLMGYAGEKIGSKTLKREVQAEKLTKSTWQRVLKTVCSHVPMPLKKELVRHEHVEQGHEKDRPWTI